MLMVNLSKIVGAYGNEPLVLAPNPQHINLRLNIETTSNEELE
jgi:hypothetical protein